MSFAFSPLGGAYLAMLFIPNMVWANLRRRIRAPAPVKESPPLLAMERVGQVAATIAALFVPATESPGSARFFCLGTSLLAMVAYELSWLRYFRTNQTDADDASLYRSLGPVPLPLATLPVTGFLLLALYEVHLILFAAMIVLGIGHIGIHRQHARRLRRRASQVCRP